MSKSKIQIGSILVLTAIMVMSFQNCGKANFSKGLDSNTSLSAGGGHSGAPVDLGGMMITDLQAQDLDGDGLPDMIVAFGANSTDPSVGSATAICWDYQHSWDAINKKFTNCNLLGDSIQTSNVVISDINHDGIPDIVQFNYGNSYVYINDGSGNFSKDAFYSSQCDALTGIVGDFNNDGYPDIAYVPTQWNFGCVAFGNPVSRDLSIIYGSANGFGAPHVYALPNNGIVNEFTTGLDHGRVSNASYDDIVIGNFRAAGFYILKSDGAGGFAANVAPIANITATPNDSYNFILADADGDGKADILIANYLNNTATDQSYIYYGNGNGTFQAGVALANSSGTLNFIVRDIDGDGHPDIIAAKSTGGSIYWGSGNRTFTQNQIYSLSSETYIKSPMITWAGAGSNLELLIGFYNGDMQLLSPMKAVTH